MFVTSVSNEPHVSLRWFAFWLAGCELFACEAAVCLAIRRRVGGWGRGEGGARLYYGLKRIALSVSVWYCLHSSPAARLNLDRINNIS